MKRRDFMKSAAVIAGAGAALARNAGAEAAAEIPKRPLGKRIDFKATIYGLGAAYVGLQEVTHEEAVRVINYVIDSGVNYLDTAPAYNNSQEKVGLVMKNRRSEVFLATKTGRRDAEGAYKEVEDNLKLLQTDVIDLMQLHGVLDHAALDAVLAPKGALEGLIKARNEGKIRHIGITGHKTPEVFVRALQQYEFDSVLIPLSAADVHYHDFAETVVPFANEKGAAVIAMKTIVSGQMIGSPTDYVRYAMSLPISVAIVGSQTIAHVDDALSAARGFVPMTPEEKWALEAKAKPLGTPQSLWWKRRA